MGQMQKITDPHRAERVLSLQISYLKVLSASPASLEPMCASTHSLVRTACSSGALAHV